MFTVIFVVDAKVNFNSYSNSMVASCDQKTIITTNPGTHCNPQSTLHTCIAALLLY